MFTSIKKSKWSFMLLAALASIAVAAMATAVTWQPKSQPLNTAGHDAEQVVTGSYTQYNTVVTRLMN